LKKDSNDIKERNAAGRTVLCVMCAAMLAVVAFTALSVTDEGGDDAAVSAAGEFYADDIEFVNAMIDEFGMSWTAVVPAAGLTEDDFKDAGWIVAWEHDAATDCSRITELDISGEGITGALNMTPLTVLLSLRCTGNSITELDVSGCTGLVKLYCESNLLTELDLTGLTALEELYVHYNNLTKLDLSDCPALNQLGLNFNDLTELDVSCCEYLVYLFCLNNSIERLTLTGLNALKELDCSANRLTELDLSDCPALEVLECYGNMIEELNADGLAALWYLKCHDNKISELSLTGCTALKELYCNNNKLEEMDVTGCPLTNIECYDNWMTGYGKVTGYGGPWSGNFRFFPQFQAPVLFFVNDGFFITLPANGTAVTSVNVSAGVTGGKTPYTFSALGLPDGLDIDGDTGIISGTPTAKCPAGKAEIYVRDDQNARDRILIGYGYAPLVYDGTAFSIPGTQVGTAIATINVFDAFTGGSGDYWVEGFLFPSGIVIDPALGTIRGTPDTAWAAGVGYMNFRDRVTGERIDNIPVSWGAMTWPPLVFNDSPAYDIPATQVGTAIANIDVAPAASGGNGTYAFSASGLPSGIAISAAGIISGTPATAATAGTATITVTSAGMSQSITIAFGAMTWPPLVFNDSPAYDIPASQVGTAISNIDVAPGASGGNGTYAFSASGLPAGITISTAGVISGTPTTPAPAGTATITVTSAGMSASITIAFGAVTGDPVTLVFTDSAAFDIPASTVGTAIAPINVAVAVSGGNGTYAFGASGLPSGIAINAATGVISGTPTAVAAAGTATITVTSAGMSASITIAFGAVSAAPAPEPEPEKGSNILLFVAIAVIAVAAIAAVVYIFVLRPKV